MTQMDKRVKIAGTTFPPSSPRVLRARVKGKREPSPGIFLMDFSAPEAAEGAAPGRFAHIRPDWGGDLLLPRPFSVHRILRDERGRPEGVSILFRVVGEGTRRLAALATDDEVRMLGPLGNGFELSPFEGTTFVVAGGMGAAPLACLVEEGLLRGAFERENTEIVYGVRTSRELVTADLFSSFGARLTLVTEDGSSGERGRALDSLSERIDGLSEPFRIFAVGPASMYAALGKRLGGRDAPCFVSMESRMACGLGACRSCVIPVRGPGGGRVYRDVCRSGPVFDLKDVLFDELEGNR